MRGSGKTGLDYQIPTPSALIPSGPKDRFRRNIDAIKTLKAIEAEGRQATSDEQRILARYTGWGSTSLQPVFHAYPRAEWRSEAAELRTLLTDEEFASAQASTPNAHYTSGEVIQGIYQALDHLGFKAGRILEPAMGVGNFFGLMPDSMREKSSLTGIEKDQVSGRIAQQLYQSADVRISGFEDALLTPNFFDLAVSNVPFGDIKIHDPKFNKYRFSIHNYFFAKALDLVRPGGIVAFVTSPFTLDSQTKAFRDYLDEQAHFLGAIRLPEGTFQGVADTQTSTDVIFLQKRGPGVETQGQAFTNRAEHRSMVEGREYGFDINEYYAAHPEQMLGNMGYASTMYGAGGAALQARAGQDLPTAIQDAARRLPRDLYQPPVSPNMAQQASPVPLTDKLPQQMLVVQGGVIHEVQGTQLVPLTDLPATTKARVTGMIGIRDAITTLRRLEVADGNPDEIERARAHLNTVYDQFVAQYGLLTGPGIANQRAFRSDPYWPHLLALEHYDRDTETATKARIFSERTNRPVAKPTRVETPSQALLTSLAWNGGIDWDDMSRLTGMSVADLQESLKAQTFLNPNGGGWETSEQYLGGDVRAKLRDARAAAQTDPRYQANVEALEPVQPATVDLHAVQVRMGSPWIPDATYREFFAQLFGLPNTPGLVRHNDALAVWDVATPQHTRLVAINETWAAGGLDGGQIANALLNFKQPKIYSNGPGGSRVFDKESTLLVHAKMERMQEAFREWLVADAQRYQSLEQLYNDTQNRFVDKPSDGSHLELPGFSGVITPRDYQKNAIWRAVRDGTMLFAHEVGAGKTLSMTGTAMELRRLGLARKPLILVPNHLINQWPAEVLRFYPDAKVLAATKRDLEKGSRQQFFGRIPTDDWDAIILPYSSFRFLPVSDQWFNSLLQEQIRQIEQVVQGIDAPRNRKGASTDKTVKELEKMKQNLVAKLKGARNVETQEAQITFEELGVDALLVDEAHNFKNLYFATKIGQMPGLGSRKGADRAFDLFAKVRYIQKLMNGRNVYFATGTPISNTIAEAYTMQRYLQPQWLKEQGIEHFDAWAGMFADTVTRMQVAPTGKGFVSRTSFSKFRNAPELLASMRQVGDIQTQRMLNLPRPRLQGDAPQVIAVPATPELKRYIDTLLDRAQNLGHVDPKVDNMLNITNDGRKAALDLRLVLPGAAEPAMTKVKAAVSKIAEIWQHYQDTKGAQLVFLDLGIPRTGEEAAEKRRAAEQEEEGEAEPQETEEETRLRTSVYSDFRAKLVAAGIPANQIAFIHDANTDARRLKLFQDVKDGRVRVLLGSTAKMGEGMNVQDRLIALHHLDSPWKPNEITQREGRILRPGNMYAALDQPVHIFRYVTEESFDAYMWQTVETKQRAFGAFLDGTFKGRSIEDLGDAQLRSFSEATAAATGNPLFLERVQVMADLERMESVRSQEQYQQIRLRRRANIEIPGQIAENHDYIAKNTARLEEANRQPGALNNRENKRVDGGDRDAYLLTIVKALEAGAHHAQASGDNGYLLGYLESPHLALSAHNGGPYEDEEGKHQRQTKITAKFGDSIFTAADVTVPLQLKDAGWIMTNLMADLQRGLKSNVNYGNRRIAELTKEREDLQPELAKPLPFEQEIPASKARLSAIEQHIDAKSMEKEPDQVSDEPEEERDEDTGEVRQTARQRSAIPQGQGPSTAQVAYAKTFRPYDQAPIGMPTAGTMKLVGRDVDTWLRVHTSADEHGPIAYGDGSFLDLARPPYPEVEKITRGPIQAPGILQEARNTQSVPALTPFAFHRTQEGADTVLFHNSQDKLVGIDARYVGYVQQQYPQAVFRQAEGDQESVIGIFQDDAMVAMVMPKLVSEPAKGAGRPTTKAQIDAFLPQQQGEGRLSVEPRAGVPGTQGTARRDPLSEAPLQATEVRKVFPGQQVTQDTRTGDFLVRTTGGHYISIGTVPRVSYTNAELQIGYGMSGLPQGKQVSGRFQEQAPGFFRIELAPEGTILTFLHETGHFFEDSGLLTQPDLYALNQELGRRGQEATKETRAQLLAEELERTLIKANTPLGRVLMKLRQWFDRIARLFGVNPSVGQITRRIQSGDVFQQMMATGEPPVAPGMTRLYRGEDAAPSSGRAVPDWITQSAEYHGTKQASGRWWTADPTIAAHYAQEATPHGRIVYQDVSHAVAEAAHLPNQAPEIQRFSLDTGHEYFLPAEYKGTGTALPARFSVETPQDEPEPQALPRRHMTFTPQMQVKAFLDYASFAGHLTPEEQAHFQAREDLFRKEYIPWTSLDTETRKVMELWAQKPELREQLLSRLRQEGSAEALASTPGAASPAQQRAFRLMADAAWQQLYDGYTQGLITQERFDALEGQWLFNNSALQYAMAGASEFGRGLQAQRYDPRSAGSVRIYQEIIQKLKAKEKQFPADVLLKMRRLATEAFASGNRDMLLSIPSQIEVPGFADYFWEWVYSSGYLAAPATFNTNAFSTFSNIVFNNALVKPVTALLDAPLAAYSGREQSLYTSSVIPTIAKTFEGVPKAMQRFWWLWKSGFGGEPHPRLGEIPGFLPYHSQRDRSPTGGSGAWARATWTQDHPLLGAKAGQPIHLMRALSPWLTTFSRAMEAMDVAMRGLAYEAELTYRAKNAAAQAATHTLGKRNRGWEDAYVTNWMKTLGDHPRDHEAALETSNVLLFREQGDKLSEVLLGLRRIPGIGWLFHLLMPFATTPANLLRRGFELIPVAGLFGTGVHEAIEWNGWMPKLDKEKLTPQVSEVLAKQVLGVLMGATLYAMYHGGLITGGAPDDPDEREHFYREGKVPYAVKVGGRWVSFRRFEPFSIALGLQATVADALGRQSEKWEREGTTHTGLGGRVEQGMSMASVAAWAAKTFIIDSSYFTGLAQFIGSSQEGRLTGGLPGGVNRQIATMVVPFVGLQRALIRAVDSTGMIEGTRAGETLVRQPGNVLETIAAYSFPFTYWANIPTRQGLYGEPVSRQASPLEVTPFAPPVQLGLQRGSQATEEAFQRTRYFPGLPNKHDAQGRAYPEDVYRAIVDMRGKLLEPRLTALTAQTGFSRLPVTEQKKAMQRVVEQTGAMARQQVTARVNRGEFGGEAREALRKRVAVALP